MTEPGLISTTALAGAERAVNAALRADPASAARLVPHAGRLVALHLSLPRTALYMLIVEDGVEFYLRSEARPDVTVTGNPADLAALLLNWRRQPGAIGAAVRIEGNRELLQELRDIAGGLSLDWGALLEPLIGGELAQQLDLGARRLFGWARQAMTRLGDQVGDYLGGEAGLLALRRDVHEFYRDVDELRGDADRLEVRVRHLQNRSKAV